MAPKEQPTPTSLRRTAVGLVALAALWNAVYWLWPVHREAPVVLAGVEDVQAEELEPQEAPAPEQPVPLVLTMGEAPDPVEAAPEIVDPMLLEPGDELGVVPPRFDPYTVAESDQTLADIAQKVYGDRSLESVIARANPFKDPRRLHAGQVWRIPVDPENIQGVLVDASGEPVEPTGPVPTSDAYTTYVVQANDTLGAISKRHYDTTRHAKFLYEYNRERLGLRSIRSIRPGQVLHVPKQPG